MKGLEGIKIVELPDTSRHLHAYAFWAKWALLSTR